MKTIENKTILFETLEPKLVADDDHALWRAVLLVLTDELAQRRAEESQRGVWGMVVGACSHWVRPHNSRWNAAGGFVYPDGYKDSVPELDWSVIFVFQNREWVSVEKLPRKKIKVFRVAIPARTARHKQAAIHTRRAPNGETVLFGFRKITDKWECVAASDEKSRGPISLSS
ncbi:MAG TPA: hypothetical protein VNO13_01830 [Candidatus Udaeobacter sp.]|nr:hypothetical protein [Candidatus Udaeobacter sp.]